jgi:hypothetical protein
VRWERCLSERRHYPNAPIIEATISIEVVPPPNLALTDLAELGELAGINSRKLVISTFALERYGSPNSEHPQNTMMP